MKDLSIDSADAAAEGGSGGSRVHDCPVCFEEYGAREARRPKILTCGEVELLLCRLAFCPPPL